MKRLGWALAIAAAASLPAVRPARAALADWSGHLSLGYGRLFVREAPAGGFSVAAGIDYPVGPGWRVGPDVGYHLLGTRSLLRGSLNANLDYSLFELALRAHWRPEHPSALRRVSFGPALMGATAEISSSSSGLAFEDQEIWGLRPGAALDAVLMPPHQTIVGVGIELGARTVLLPHDVWTVATARLALQY